MVVIQIAGGLVLLVLIVAFFLRGRLSGRRGASSKKTTSRSDFRPTLPPSPYQPSRGFRLIDGKEPAPPAPVQLPRLDPNKEFVFGDAPVVASDSLSPPHLRHDERWALERSMRHVAYPHLRRRRRWAWALVLAALVVAAAAFAFLHHSPPSASHPAGWAPPPVVRLL